ncbi:MAG: efflux RND transporter periplasmic adaptor subunit [Gammaproteobacteria bacterium]|nr:efflux RND transporter periplasmic adaptor subunit [Gammaproteobacteria bacterium]
MSLLRRIFIYTSVFTVFIPQAVTAELATVESRLRTVEKEVVVDGILEAINRTTVSAQTSGQVKAVLVDIDDYVTKGDLLVRLNDTEQRSLFQAADARYQEAKLSFERSRGLLEKALISQAEFDRAKSAYSETQAARAQAQEQLDYTAIRAPYSGIVIARHIEVGEIATPGREVMTGISLEELRAEAGVPQSKISAVRHFSRARVILEAGHGRVIAGEKMTFSPYADPASHTFKVRVNLPRQSKGDPGNLYPGTYVKVAFVAGEEDQLVVPTATVVHRGEVTALYVVNGEQISLRMVRLGRNLEDGVTEILAGLDKGETVALDPIAAGVALKNRYRAERSQVEEK